MASVRLLRCLKTTFQVRYGWMQSFESLIGQNYTPCRWWHVIQYTLHTHFCVRNCWLSLPGQAIIEHWALWLALMFVILLYALKSKKPGTSGSSANWSGLRGKMFLFVWMCKLKRWYWILLSVKVMKSAMSFFCNWKSWVRLCGYDKKSTLLLPNCH